jgi:hypothetical protein
MAITRTQQARQMLKDGNFAVQGGVKNYLGEQETVSDVPIKWQSGPDKPSTELAYITKAEKDLLLKKDIHGSLKDGPNKGPGGLMSLDSFGDDPDDPGKGFSGADVSAAERGEKPAGMSQKQADEFRGGAIAAGAGTEGKDDTAGAKREAEKIKKESEKRRRDARRAITKEEKIEARKTRKKMQELKKRDLLARQQRIKDILSGKIDYLSETERADLEALGLDPAFEGPLSPEQQIAFDNLIEKSDKLSGVNLEAFQNKFDLPKTGITSLDLALSALEGPLKAGSKKTREFFSDPDYMGLFGKKKKPSVLEAGKFTYEGLPIDPTVFGRLGTAEMEEIYGNYMDKRMSGEIDAYGNPGPATRGGPDEQTDPCKGPNPPAYCFIGGNAPTTPDPVFTPAFRFMNRGGMVEDAPMGGIMDLETTRQMLFIGGIAKGISKGLKSITRGIKKVAKSPIGKAAILGTIGYGLGGGFSAGGFKLGNLPGAKFFSNMTLPKLITDNMTGLKVAGLSGLAGLLLANVGKDDDDDFNIEEYYRTAGIDIPENQYRFLAEGGSTEKEPVAKKTMPLLDLEGQEMDFRQDGGFVPIGRMEKADDVPARLSKNEFVFTAEAVRNAGGGDVDKGAEVMYNTMKNLEAGGEVSEETQGLEGARKMFQTSQRLGEVV